MKKIIFFCGHSDEEFSPKSEHKGIGGSEEAVINIARALARRGHEVVVYNRCGDDEGKHEGVRYENYEYYKSPKCDVLVFWRNPQYVIKYGREEAKVCLLWLHDTMPEHMLLEVKHFVDAVLVLSSYHANLYPHMKEKLVQTTNGINLGHFEGKVKRDPYKIVYGSSYDRGLKELLEMWSEIKLGEPRASLTFFYGDAALKKYPDFLEYLGELKAQEGVRDLGRISHSQVAREFLSAGVWAYPSWFPEISCITAMKAQAGGAIPVITPTSALCETVRWGYTTREPRDEKGEMPWGTEMPSHLMDEFVRLSKKALSDTNFPRELMRQDAKRFSWERTAESWHRFLTGDKK